MWLSFRQCPTPTEAYIYFDPVSGTEYDRVDYLIKASTKEAIEYRKTMRSHEGGTYPTQQLAALAVEVAQALDTPNIKGDAWNHSRGIFPDQELRKVFPDPTIVSTVWRVIFLIAARLYSSGVRNLQDAKTIYKLGQSELSTTCGDTGIDMYVCQEYSQKIERRNLEMQCDGEGCTFYYVALDPAGKVVVRSYGEVENWGRIILFVAGAALAITGIGAAVASIAAEGITLANAAGLVSGIGALPGVDLGVAEVIAGGISSGLKLVDTLPGGTNVLNFGDFDVDIPDWDVLPDVSVPGGFDLGVSVPGGLDLDISLPDLGVDLAPGALDDIVNNLVNFDIDIAATDVFVDELGNVFDITGAAIAVDPDIYVKSIYVDELGNIYDYSNNVILGADEAIQIFDELGSDALDAKLAEILDGQAGDTLVSREAAGGRPAGAPQPGGQVQVPTWLEGALSLVKAYFSYDLAREQIKRTGRYTPSYTTNTTGQRVPQVPGVPVRQADGSVVVNNGDGTITTTRPDGSVFRSAASLNPGTFNPALPGGSLIPGVSNTTALLLAGGAVLAVALLSRRTK